MWAILFGLGCSVMAYGLHWKRGPIYDDYFLYGWFFLHLLDLVRVDVRSVGKLIGTVIFSQPEVVAGLHGEAMLEGPLLEFGIVIY